MSAYPAAVEAPTAIDTEATLDIAAGAVDDAGTTAEVRKNSLACSR